MHLYSASTLKQQPAGRHVAPLGNIILISSQPMFDILLNAVCLPDKYQIPIVL